MLRTISLLFLLTSCAGFYSRSKQPVIIQTFTVDELKVVFEMSFSNGGHFVDEIEISSKDIYENRINDLKKNIINLVKSINPKKKITVLRTIANSESGCVLTVKFNESLNSKSQLASSLTLFIWPYIDKREVTVTSKLSKEAKLISESTSRINYKAIISLFMIPLAPFQSLQTSEKEAWKDAYQESLSKIEFSKCK